MAITNWVAGGEDRLAGDSGDPRPARHTGYTGAGVGVAILTRASRPLPADSPSSGAGNFVSDNRASGRSVGHGTHIAGIVAGSRTAATYVTSAFAGGSAPA